MSERSTAHASFEIQRHYDSPPDRVFAAFADPVLKARWFSGPEEWVRRVHEMDFRVGGSEMNRVGPPGGPLHTFRARYEDIVSNERIVYSYQMYLDEQRTSVSLATIEFAAAISGTSLTFTEQVVFLDGYETVEQREAGSRDLFDALGSTLRELSRG